MHIYDKFVFLCEAKGVDEVTAYKEAGINKGTISLWRTAKKNGEEKIPSTKIAVKLSDYFEVPMAYILGETDDPSDRSKTHWAELLPVQKNNSATIEGNGANMSDFELLEAFRNASDEKREAIRILLGLK